MSLSFDEINKLNSTHRAMPFDKYFGEMILSKNEKKNRITLADKLEYAFLDFFAFVVTLYEYGKIDSYSIGQKLLDGYKNVLISEGIEQDETVIAYMDRFAKQFASSTLMHANVVNVDLSDYEALDNKVTEGFDEGSSNANKADLQADAWYLSQDRARFAAENESQLIYNYDQWRRAKASGYTQKKWCTIVDKVTRNSHIEANGQIAPIDEYFIIGGSLMRFPKDDTLGAGPDEIINCRCTVEYM